MPPKIPARPKGTLDTAARWPAIWPSGWNILRMAKPTTAPTPRARILPRKQGLRPVPRGVRERAGHRQARARHFGCLAREKSPPSRTNSHLSGLGSFDSGFPSGSRYNIRMIITALLAAVLAAPVSAGPLECVPNEMTSAWEKISFALWLTDYTIPDSSPRTATLAYKGCSKGDEGEESRSYSSADGLWTVTAFTNHGGDNGATTLTLYRGAQWARLGTWAHHKVFYKAWASTRCPSPTAATRRSSRTSSSFPKTPSSRSPKTPRRGPAAIARSLS